MSENEKSETSPGADEKQGTAAPDVPFVESIKCNLRGIELKLLLIEAMQVLHNPNLRPADVAVFDRSQAVAESLLRPHERTVYLPDGNVFLVIASELDLSSEVVADKAANRFIEMVRRKIRPIVHKLLDECGDFGVPCEVILSYPNRLGEDYRGKEMTRFASDVSDDDEIPIRL